MNVQRNRPTKTRPRAAAFLVAALAMTVLPSAASAYVGPTVGIGLIGAAIGLLLTVIMAIGVIVSWPLRRLKRRMKAKNAPQAAPELSGEDAE